MRIGGLATGMDTESIIRDMMAAQRLPLDKITQKKQYLEWQLDDYRSINRNLFDFSQNTFSNMILSNSFTAKTVSVSAPDDVSIRNISSTSDFSGSLQIHQLAKNATMQSSDRIVSSNADLSKSLKELDIIRTVPSSFTIKAINAEGEFDEGGYEVKLDANSTLKSVLDDINENSDVSAYFDSFTGKIAFTAKNSGKVEEGKEIEFSGNYTFLKVEKDNRVAADKSRGTKGANAEFTFNGLKTERSSNIFQINGFEINLKQATTPLDKDGVPISGEKTITFSSAPDTDKILETVVKFVDDYNKLIEDLNAKIREPKYRDFHPLSTEQKSEMKEKEIELWEEKAMSGTLRNDPIISSMLSKMRTALMGKVEGVDITLSDIGITTSKDYLENGKLVIDEDKLREAISEDPNKIHELFSKSGETDEGKGLARRLREAVEDTQKLISARAGKANSVNDTFALGRNLNDMDKQIERFQSRLEMTESRLWKQFTAMEMAIQRANAQSAQLMGAFGGGM